eukprot:m.436620 g.436620  ORF g.436620 m.436620 type:complete len:69 (+) comp21426_c0_seq11:1481-1687(+)
MCALWEPGCITCPGAGTLRHSPCKPGFNVQTLSVACFVLSFEYMVTLVIFRMGSNGVDAISEMFLLTL